MSKHESDRPIPYTLTALAVVELGRAPADPWRDALRASDVPVFSVDELDELGAAEVSS